MATKPTIPDFLNDDFFKAILIKDLAQSEIKVIETKVSVASKPGDNYTSTIYGVIVTFKEGDSKIKNIANFIVKSIIAFPKEVKVEEFGTITKEVNVYNDLLPKLRVIAGNIQFSPKCYDIVKKPTENFIFEDMRAHGYKVGDREVGLDEAHFRVTLRKIGKFHAASMELLRKQPTIEEKFLDGFFTKRSVEEEIFRNVFASNFLNAADLVSDMPGYERFADKLRKFHHNFTAIALEAVKFDEKSDLKVLNHGDLWVNNFLFKYDEETNQPKDIVYVDYQGTFFGSPGIDINYLFATSATLEVLKRKWQLIEDSYYPAFANMLKELQFPKIPSLEDLRRVIQKREMYTLISMFAILPLISMNREESKTNSFDQFMDKERNEKKQAVGMGSKRFRDTMKYMLVKLENDIDETINKY